MSSELTTLLKLYRVKGMPDEAMDLILERIKDIEESLYKPNQGVNCATRIPQAPHQSDNPVVANQQPSMQRLMANNPDLIPKPPVPVTPQAAQALAARQALINGAMSEKPEPERKGPRKV